MLRTELAEVNQADFGTAPLPEAAANPVQKEGQDFPLVIATMPATESEERTTVSYPFVRSSRFTLISMPASSSTTKTTFGFGKSDILGLSANAALAMD